MCGATSSIADCAADLGSLRLSACSLTSLAVLISSEAHLLQTAYGRLCEADSDTLLHVSPLNDAFGIGGRIRF